MKKEIDVNKKDIDDLLGSRSVQAKVRHISPGEYVVVICLVLTSLYLLVTSFFPLVYNVATSFEPVNFLMNLFYFILGIGCMAGAFLVLKKETHLEHMADYTFDKVIYKRLEPVLRDVADVQVGLSDIHHKLEMMNLNIEKMGQLKEQPVKGVHAEAPAQTSMYIKYIVMINITLATFLFMLQYPLEYVPYAVTIIYIAWWLVITAEFKLWNVESAWMWVFVPILILPIYTIIMNVYLLDYQMFGSLFLGLCAYIIAYYSWCSNMVRGVLPFDLHIALREFKKKPMGNMKPMPLKLKISFKPDLYNIGISMMIGSIALFAAVWFGFSIEHGLIPITWKTLYLEEFMWEPLYSYALTFLGILFLVLGFSMVLKFRRSRS